MGFLSDITIPNSLGNNPVNSGGFLSNVVLPTIKTSATSLRETPQILQNPKGDGYPALNPDGSQVTPDAKLGIIGSTKQALLAPIQKANPLTVGADTVKQAEVDAGTRIRNAIDTWHSSTPLQKGVNVGSSLVGVVNALFSPVSGLIKTAENTPVISPVAHIVNNIFGTIGTAGGSTASAVVDKLPISENTKNTIRPLVTELGALTAQIATGKAGGELVKLKVTDLSKQIVDHVQNDVATPKVMSNATETKIPISTPKTRFEEYNKTQGYEPIIPDSQLPVIDAGKVAKSDLPTIQTVPREAPVKGDLTYESVKGGFLDNVVKPETSKEIPFPKTTNSYTEPIKSVVEPKTVPQPIENIKPAQPTTIKEFAPTIDISGQKQSKVGTSIESKAIEKSLTKGFGDTAGYDPITIKDQAERASNLMNRDIGLARDMVKGNIPMESGLKGEMLIKAMEDHAEKTGNVELLRDIANSPLVSETSAHAQAMRILAERNPDSVVTKLGDIKKARETAFEKKTGKKADKAVKDTVKEIKSRVTIKKEDWSSFIESIKC